MFDMRIFSKIVKIRQLTDTLEFLQRRARRREGNSIT